jgi:hypothetical protein
MNKENAARTKENAYVGNAGRALYLSVHIPQASDPLKPPKDVPLG